MNNLLLKKITIFLTVDEKTIDSYFNAHDPSPVYKRQLSHDFEKYISSCIVAIKRYSTIRFKLVCKNESDRQFIDPLIHAIRRHFSVQKVIKESEFRKFKKGSYKLLGISMTVVTLSQFFMITVLKEDTRLNSLIGHSLDIFSWVILWTPIDKLVFSWNPFLKDISIYERLMNAEIIISETNTIEMSMPEMKYA